ncbi:hypothetical protein KK449_07630 [Clostridioides difficile]|nr:hypothetical protein [Clostridioides difficile]
MAKFWDCLDMALSYYENPTSFKQEVQNDVNSIGENGLKLLEQKLEKKLNRILLKDNAVM